MQPRPVQMQMTAAQALRNVSLNIDQVNMSCSGDVKIASKTPGDKTILNQIAYKVVFPDTYCVLVSALVRHDGQSTGADPSPRFGSGVAVWY